MTFPEWSWSIYFLTYFHELSDNCNIFYNDSIFVVSGVSGYLSFAEELTTICNFSFSELNTYNNGDNSMFNCNTTWGIDSQMGDNAPFDCYNKFALIDNHLLYVTSGNTDVLGNMWIFDLLLNKRINSSNYTYQLLYAVEAPCTVTDPKQENVYVIGGMLGDVATNLLQIYNIANDTWILSSDSMPNARAYSSCVADFVNNVIYVTGGIDESDEF